MAAEPGLAESADPEALVVADLTAVDGVVEHLRALGAALDRTANGLRDIDTGQWTGDAADAFRERFDESPVRWFAGADAFSDAATAYDAYRRTVRRSREQAARAVELYRAGRRTSEAAVRERDAAVADFDTRLAAATTTGGPAPEPLPDFTDPGVPMIEQATAMLDAARRDRDEAGADAAQVVQVAAASAPDPPSTLAQAGAELVDGLAEGGRLLDGIGDGVEDAVRAARTVNPLDPWNLTHPASYVDGVSSVAAGAVTAQLHPAELVKGAVGTGWGSDPATALGRLVPGLAMSATTGGLGRQVEAAAASPRMSAGRAIAEAGSGTSPPERPPPKTEDSPDLPARAELGPMYRGEQYGRSPVFPGQRVEYFDDARREKARLTVRDGLLYDSDGQRFDSDGGESFWSPDEPMAIFVMDPKGNLYVSLEQDVGRIHHSSLLAGAPVAGAGEISAVDGRVTVLSEESGHYAPPAECLDQVVDYLRNEGVDLGETEVRRHGD
ncbi:WXG100 family type VII secretion target [Pseudonocardia endophytica]|uniref:Putative T7SS secretion signal domain-containing protein n=1 Tax=Pseudonocardia endophytica TaxID=401976 RepID=A0A4R1HDM6_PSEEN|nr:hypothetical protein [Pseudonocardia endophytica]TCK20144.1 hypothetical protein EV378_4093 [Pseudonocardia endophytica]